VTHVKKGNDWQLYRTRFLVKAKRLSGPLSFKDALGREQHGEKGDYLVEWCDGVLCIQRRAIFEDIYVPMEQSAPDWRTVAQHDPSGDLDRPGTAGSWLAS
jgi:hypothetical protein